MTAYEMRISDWSSDVCSSDLQHSCRLDGQPAAPPPRLLHRDDPSVAGGAVPGARGALQARRDALGNCPAGAEARRTYRRGAGGTRSSRSDERRVGEERVSKGSYWWAATH